MVEIEKLKSLHVAQISLLISIIILQEINCKYYSYPCTVGKKLYKIHIDTHTKTKLHSGNDLLIFSKG